MGAAGGAFAQGFAQTLIQGQQLIQANRDRREELDLRKKLVGAQLQQHDAATALATRKLEAMTGLRERLAPDLSFGEEEGSGLQGVTPAKPLSDDERLNFASALDPDAAAKSLLAGDKNVDVLSIFEKLTAGMGREGQQGASRPTAAASGQAAPAEAPPAVPAPPETPTLGPQRKLERSVGLSVGDDGKLKLDLKVGERNVAYKIDQVAEPLPDGRVQLYRVATNPEDPRQVQKVPVGAPQYPEALRAFTATAQSWGLKPGSELYGAAVADMAAVTTMYQPGRAQETAFADLQAKYRALATTPATPAQAGVTGKVTAPAAAGSPRARADAEEVEQAGKVAGATAAAKDKATRDAPIGDDAVRYINRRTLQHPSAEMKRRDVEGSADYVQVAPDVAKKLPQYQTTKAALDSLEAIVLRRPDLFPPKGKSEPEDIGRVLAATARYRATAKTDTDIGTLESLRISMPGTIKLFGDSGNISEAERAMAESALGLTPSTREQALERIDALRGMVNNTVAPMGLPPIQRKPGPRPEVKFDPGEPVFDWDEKNRRRVPVKR